MLLHMCPSLTAALPSAPTSVGGKILNSVLGKMSRHGQIIACGAIASEYQERSLLRRSVIA
jgi:NADPH-dependent curcumin reductase CurA